MKNVNFHMKSTKWISIHSAICWQVDHKRLLYKDKIRKENSIGTLDTHRDMEF